MDASTIMSLIRDNLQGIKIKRKITQKKNVNFEETRPKT